MKIKVKLLIEGQHFTPPPGSIPPGKRWMDGLQYEITDQVFRHPRYYPYYTAPCPSNGKRLRGGKAEGGKPPIRYG